MRTNVVRALADVVATKLGIILSFFLLFSFFFFLSSFHVLPNLRVAKGPERSGGTQTEDFLGGVGSGRWSACAMGK